MATNLSSTVPAAPTGGRLVTWQQDVSGNTSAYTSMAPSKITVAPIAGVLTLDLSLANSFLITVNAPITSMVLINPTDGQEPTLLWAQDSTGHAITLATNLIGATAPSTAANKHSIQKFSYNVGDTNYYGVSAGQTGL